MRTLGCLVLALCAACGAESQGESPPVEIGGAGGGDMGPTAPDAGGEGGEGGAGGPSAGPSGYRLTGASLRVGGGRPVDAAHDLVGGTTTGAVGSTNASGRLIAVITD